jgi:AcrR family transcriptional regulator
MSEETVPEESLTTRDKIVLVLEGMEKEDEYVITISGVAKAVGIHPSTIHNRYPDLHERIHKSAGVVKEKNAKEKLAKRSGTIKEERAMRARLRIELDETKELLRKVNSVNATLVFEKESLQTRLDKELHKHRARIVDIRDTVFKRD